jgi:hypothetical protein
VAPTSPGTDRKLATTRDINSTLLLAPAVHSTGPGGNYSIAGSMSYENLFMINGVSVNENIRGTPYTCISRTRFQATTVSTAGVSAEYGRFGGGVVNLITKSGGNTFSGSFRDSLNNDDWRALVPKRDGDLFANDTKLDKVVPTYEYTFGGPIIRIASGFYRRSIPDAGIVPGTPRSRTLPIRYQQVAALRGQRHLLAQLEPPDQGSVHQGELDLLNDTVQSVDHEWICAALYNRSTPQDISTISYSGVLTPTLFWKRASRSGITRPSGGRPVDRHRRGHAARRQPERPAVLVADLLRHLLAGRARQRGHLLQGSYFLSTPEVRIAQRGLRYDNFNDIRKGQQPAVRAATTESSPALRSSRDRCLPVFLNDGSTQIQWNPIPIVSEGSNFRTHSLFFNDSWRATKPSDGKRRHPLRQESRQEPGWRSRDHGRFLQPAAGRDLGSQRHRRLVGDRELRQVRSARIQPNRRCVVGRG